MKTSEAALREILTIAMRDADRFALETYEQNQWQEAVLAMRAIQAEARDDGLEAAALIYEELLDEAIRKLKEAK